MTSLTVAPCSYQAAAFAVTRWHYSRVMPAGKLVKHGAWEHGRFVGAVVFGRGAAPALASPYDLDQTEVCELVRVALTDHEHPVTQILAASLRLLQDRSPNLRLVVSFADEAEGHHGGIYQAGNWIYTGRVDQTYFRVNGRLVHPKSLHSKYGLGGQSIPWLREHVDPNATREPRPPKHRYLMPLDKAMRRRVAKLAQPYPTRGQGLDGETPPSHGGGAGSTPAARSTTP